MKIKVHKPTQEELKKLDVSSWATWEKEVSRFDWHYPDAEVCYFLEGRVVVETKDGERVEISKGDFATFPKGLSCTWDIKEPVRKHYSFE